MKDLIIMVVDDELAILDGIRDALPDFPICCFSNPIAARDALDDRFFDIIVADYRMPTLSGLDFFMHAKRKKAYRYGILLTAYADKELLRSFINKDLIHQVIEKPLKMEELERSLMEGKAICAEMRQREEEYQVLRKRYEALYQKTHFLNDAVIGEDGGLREIFADIRRIAATSENILLTGETGTGKEVIARTIHSLSTRNKQPFIKINCGAIPETLIEDDLFGHVKGAYSGAYSYKQGKIELANKGTLFLDEIGELRPELQTKLLQVVQEKKIERIGSVTAIPVDFRLISATNQNMEEVLRSGRFRRDLFYRIATFHLTVPPLRERRNDIPPLVIYLLGVYEEEFGRSQIRISEEAMEKLQSYDWPGNIRELESVLKRAVSLLDRERNLISEEDILHQGLDARPLDMKGAYDMLIECMITGNAGIRDIEKNLLERTLSKFDGNVYKASKTTGIPKDRFYRNVK